MLLPVKCRCGKSFLVSERRHGQVGRCPSCGVKIVVEFEGTRALAVPGADLEHLWAGNDVGDGVFPSGLIATASVVAEEDEEPGPIGTMRPPISPTRAAESLEHDGLPAEKPARVVLVGLRIPFEDLFVFVFQVWAASLALGLLTAFVVGILYAFSLSFINH